ncbi:terminase large subunit [Staphylococcus succinus]|uniref:terminase large subunit n=1 Tax=Staphylococcus succinus TaxID=61015 RepID=UPI00301BFE1E
MANVINDRTTDYAKKVVSGEILASKKNILSCERHLRDMKLKVLNYHFDIERANRVIKFVELLPVPKTMENMELKQFQCYIIGSLFGWVDELGNRRFTKGYISMARKNGKTLLLAGIALYDLMLGQEPKFERTVGIVSNTQKQATLAWKDAKTQLEALRVKSKTAKQSTKITPSVYELTNTNDRSVIKAFSREADNLEGELISTGIIDEAHLLKDTKVYEGIRRGQTFMENPSLYYISTAGSDLTVPFFDEYNYITKVLEGEETNERYFVFCAEQDNENEMHNPETWIKANPLLEDEDMKEVLISNLQDDISEGVAKGEINSLLIKSFNMWRQDSSETYIQLSDWQKGYTESKFDVKGRDVYVGVDLSRSEDLTALSFIYPTSDESYFVDTHVFVGTKGSILEKSKRDKINYEKLVSTDNATLTTAESGIIDPEQVVRWLIDFIGENQLNVKAICYDPWESSYFVTKMEKETDHPLVEVPQNYRNLGPILKQFRLDVFEKRIKHNDNPNLNLAIANAITKTDNNNNMILDKKINRQKIDALVSLVTGYSQAMNHKFDREFEKFILSDDFGF